jgi:four helix bundle protein
MRIRDYRDLIVWQKAIKLVEMVYRVTKKFPKEEIYALSNQIRRAAVSIPSNIAEGHARKSTRVFLQFLSVAYGSLKEVETQIYISLRLQYITEKDSRSVFAITEEIGRIISGLRSSLKRRRKMN